MVTQYTVCKGAWQIPKFAGAKPEINFLETKTKMMTGVPFDLMFIFEFEIPERFCKKKKIKVKRKQRI